MTEQVFTNCTNSGPVSVNALGREHLNKTRRKTIENPFRFHHKLGYKSTNINDAGGI